MKKTFEREFLDKFEEDLDISATSIIDVEQIVEHFSQWQQPTQKEIVPEFVAKYLEEGSLAKIVTHAYITPPMNYNKVERWVADNFSGCISDNLVNFKLNGFITEESKEKKYCAKIFGGEYLGIQKYAGYVSVNVMLDENNENINFKTKFTKEELSRIESGKFFEFRISDEYHRMRELGFELSNDSDVVSERNIKYPNRYEKINELITLIEI